MNPPTNAIREIVRSRIRVLVENGRNASAMSHAATVGDLREAYLRQFLAALVPQRFAITSGFITDPLGNLSPQLDFIAYDRSALPPIVLPTDVAVVPVDAAVLVAEIKSGLAGTTLEQVKRQRDSIGKMYHTYVLQQGARFIVPHVVLAFESTLSAETVENWFKEVSDLLSVCVVSSFSIDRIAKNEVQRILPSAADEHVHVLTFVFRLFNLLEKVVSMRLGQPPRLEDYLLPERPANATADTRDSQPGLWHGDEEQKS